MSLYVFGYGSLMWRPGFPHVTRQFATVRGRHRRLCVYSFVHRGTEARPGLVLGLDRGGTCRGVAFEVTAAEWDGVVEYLREREQVTSVYLERTLPAVLADGRTVPALGYVVDRAHRQYAGRLSHAQTVEQVRGAVGRSGPNEEYVLNTADHLTEAGIVDRELHTVAALLRQPA